MLDLLRARFPQLEVRPASQTFRIIRMVKTPAEHERLIAALRATEHALRTTVGEAREGVTEAEPAPLRAGRCGEEGTTWLHAAPLRPWYGPGPGGARREPSAQGELRLFDVGCTLDGYRSDIGRVVGFGEPSDRRRAYYAASKGGQSRAFELSGVQLLTELDRELQVVGA